MRTFAVVSNLFVPCARKCSKHEQSDRSPSRSSNLGKIIECAERDLQTFDGNIVRMSDMPTITIDDPRLRKLARLYAELKTVRAELIDVEAWYGGEPYGQNRAAQGPPNGNVSARSRRKRLVSR